MKKILIINPNSSISMTNDVKKTVEYYKSDFKLEVIRMKNSPNVLESFKDYTFAGYETINYLNNNNIKDRYAGIALACFGDPCIRALKEISKVPLIGIAEASMASALLLGYKFSIISASKKSMSMMESLVAKNKLLPRLASVETLDISIGSFINNAELLKVKFMECAKDAIGKGCEVLIYGCAGMTKLSYKDLSKELGLPVLDPLICGVTNMEAIIKSDSIISNVGLYAKH